LVFGDTVVTTWAGSCTSSSGFGITWATIDGAEAFKPDGKNGAMVPCDEYFEVSFSFVDNNNNVINFPALVTGTSSFYSVVQKLNTNGNYVITIPPEINSFGCGFVDATGAVTASTNTPFAFSCTNNVANVKVRTNYLLTATNDGGTPNYARELNTVIDSGNWGTGLQENMPANPTSGFAIGQTMCAGVNMPVVFNFPAGVIIPTGTPASIPVTLTANAPVAATTQPNTPVVPPTPVSPTNSNNPSNTPIQAIAATSTTGNGKLSTGGVVGIIFLFIILGIVGVIVGIILFLKFKKHATYEWYVTKVKSKFGRGTF